MLGALTVIDQTVLQNQVYRGLYLLKNTGNASALSSAIDSSKVSVLPWGACTEILIAASIFRFVIPIDTATHIVNSIRLQVECLPKSKIFEELLFDLLTTAAKVSRKRPPKPLYQSKRI